MKAKRSFRRDLPRYYYHTNFCEFLGLVCDLYQPVFNAAAQAFVDDFHALPRAAQCAYIRLASRKGSVFTVAKLDYPEIAEFETQLDILRETGFASGVTEMCFTDWLTQLTKPDLIEVLAEHTEPGTFKRSWPKGALVEVGEQFLNPVTAVCPTDRRYVAQGRQAPLSFLLYLYFGRIERNLAAFTLRDLGIMRRNDFREDFEARFDRAEDAAQSYFYAHAVHRHETDPKAADQLIADLPVWPAAECDTAQMSRDRLLRKLGGLCERRGDNETALTLYQKSDTPRCNERAIRLMWAAASNAEEKTAVRTRLEAMIDSPASDGELDFATDFLARKFHKKRTSTATDLLRASERVTIDEAYKGSPERALAARLEAAGDTVYFTENRLWKTLFGLLFWDEIFDPDAALHNAFERRPRSLIDGTFYDTYADRIEAKLDALSGPDRLLPILKTIATHHRELNGVFQWHGRTIDGVQAFLACDNSANAAGILRAMARDYRRTKDGFPDLMCIRDNRARFIEVKAEGDALRRNQMTRLRQMGESGLPVSLTRVAWDVDPDQVYVVVDVETTGGRPPYHRMTEIGAVKIVRGQVVDTFQSLLNPDRHIPAHITSITGISNAMVANAPRFHEIADAFCDFMEGAIFCAHNVNFDYKFISAEYARLDRWFRFPKLCTVASMRKFYPGLRSYSLKNLTAEFDISLETHHRALCDARAAAGLLVLVNAKRAPESVSRAAPGTTG